MSARPRARGVGLAAILSGLFPAALLCALFVAVGVMHVTSRVLVVHVGYKLSTLNQDSRELTRERDRLTLELATLKSPAKLEHIARERLEMSPPNAGTVFTAPMQSPAPTAVRQPSKTAGQGG